MKFLYYYYYYSRERPGGDEENGKAKEVGTVTEDCQAGQNELSIGVLFDKLDSGCGLVSEHGKMMTPRE